jgi:hypothetical protein
VSVTRSAAEILDRRPEVFFAFADIDDYKIHSLIWMLLLLSIAEDGLKAHPSELKVMASLAGTHAITVYMENALYYYSFTTM